MMNMYLTETGSDHWCYVELFQNGVQVRAFLNKNNITHRYCTFNVCYILFVYFYIYFLSRLIFFFAFHRFRLFQCYFILTPFFLPFLLQIFHPLTPPSFPRPSACNALYSLKLYPSASNHIHIEPAVIEYTPSNCEMFVEFGTASVHAVMYVGYFQYLVSMALRPKLIFSIPF